MINYLHCYVNSRPDVDWNTCGQAAIATITDYWGRNPYGLPRTKRDWQNGLYYWDDGKAIDAIKGGGFGPDVAFGWGTTGGRIRDALKKYGLNSSVGYSGVGSWGWQDQWKSLQNYVNVNRPVPVMVDLGLIGGPDWMVHWAIAYKVAAGKVYLGACPWNPSPSITQFQDAWHCRALPYGFNHCGVVLLTHIPQFGGRIFVVFRRVGVSTRRRTPYGEDGSYYCLCYGALGSPGHRVAGVCREIGLWPSSSTSKPRRLASES